MHDRFRVQHCPIEVYRRIKDLILDGNLAPGELVTIQGLADAFDVSAMPVREALTRLTSERALMVVAGRSVGIPNLDSRRLQDLTRGAAIGRDDGGALGGGCHRGRADRRA